MSRRQRVTAVQRAPAQHVRAYGTPRIVTNPVGSAVGAGVAAITGAVLGAGLGALIDYDVRKSARWGAALAAGASVIGNTFTIDA